MKQHLSYFFDRIRGGKSEKPSGPLELNAKNESLFQSHFYPAFDELKFKNHKKSFEKLLGDEDFLVVYMRLFPFDKSHAIFNNIMQALIQQFQNQEIQDFVVRELPAYQCKFNPDWSAQTVGTLIDRVLDSLDPTNSVELILQILTKSDCKLELILKLITTRLQLADHQRPLTKVNELHPIVHLIVQVFHTFHYELDDVLKLYHEVTTAFRHFFRDIIRDYAQAQKATRLSDFLLSAAQQLPTIIDGKHQANTLISIIVNEVANTVGYLQHQKKLFSSSKLRLIDILIHLQRNTSLHIMNFYFNHYEAKQNNKVGKCQLCLYEDCPLVEFKELETHTLMVECCKECYYTKIPEQLPDISAFEDQIYFPSILYGEAATNPANAWMKISFENYHLHKLKPTKSLKVPVAQIQEAQAYFDQLTKDFKNLENPHYYLPYYAQMSFFLVQSILPTYKNADLILLAFLEDSSIQARSKVLEHFTEMLVRMKKMQTPIDFFFSCYDEKRILQKIFQRSQDVAKQIRVLTVKCVLKIWSEAQVPCLELLIKRLVDIEISVRIKTLKACLEYTDVFQNLQNDEQIYFFEEVSKRLQEKGQVSDEAAKLILQLLVKNNSTKDRDITIKLIEIMKGTGEGYRIDTSRLQSLIEKLSDENEIIDRNEVLYHAIMSLVSYVKDNQTPSIESSLKLIEILIQYRSTNLKAVALKHIDNIMSICNQFLENHDERNYRSAEILNSLFKLLIFCLEELENPQYKQLPFPLTAKITKTLELLQVFIEKIIFSLHPKTPYMRSIFSLSVLLDLLFSKNHKNIYKKLEIVIKLIFMKSNSPLSFQFSLLAFSQLFHYVEFYITKCQIDVKEFFSDTINSLYDYLMELSQEKSATEEIMFAIQKIWQKIPQLMFASQEFLKTNLETNKFEDQVVIAIYQIFYESITDATKSAQNQQFDLVDQSSIAYMVKEIFNITFKSHIFHPNKKLRLIILKLIECLFENQLSLALHFGDYLIAAQLEDSEAAAPIIKKCLEERPEHMLLQFQNGISLMIKHHRVLQPFFTNLDAILRNLTKTEEKTYSKNYDVVTTKLSDYLMLLDDQYFHQKSEHYYEAYMFVLHQLIGLPYLSSREIKYIIKALLNRINDLISKAEQAENRLNPLKEDSKLVKLALTRLFSAYAMCINHQELLGEETSSLRQLDTSKFKFKAKQKEEIQCYATNSKKVKAFLQLLNQHGSALKMPREEVSDSEFEAEEQQTAQHSLLSMDNLDLIYDYELGQIDGLLEKLDRNNDQKVLKPKKQQMAEESKVEESEEEWDSKAKSKSKSKMKRQSKSRKRKPRKTK